MSNANIDMQDIPTLPASLSTSSQLDLENVDLNTLQNNMNKHSATFQWLKVVEKDTDDQWQRLLQNVVSSLTSELEETELKSKVIEPLNWQESFAMVNGFNEEVLNKWKDGTRMGLKQGDWTGLINLAKHKKVPNVALGVPMKLKDAVIRAWKQDYHGNGHKTLLNALDDLQDHSHTAYVKIIPMAQSSGTGKSKTVDRIGEDRILFPMCLREDLGENVFAYPLSDTVVRDHLSLAPSVRDEACIDYLNAFLSSLFAQVYKETLALFSDKKPISYKEMAMAFHNFFADPEKKCVFYEGVVNRAKENNPSKNVSRHFKQLRERLEKCCTNWPATKLPIIISLDEVHVLYNPRSVDSGTDYTLYSRLSLALSQLVNCSFAVVTMSTASHLPSLAPPPAIAPSLRERADNLFHPAPFTELPFDAYIIANPLEPGKETLGSVGSLEFTARFGRPLFYATYLSRSNDQNGNNIAEQIISVIREKLSGRPWPPLTEAAADLDESSVAILSARLLLDLSPASICAKPYEVELVRNHLRMLYSAHENRITLVTGSSPEPLIAEASAQIMHYRFKNSDKNYIDLWDLLFKFIDHGLADQGAIGELIGRTLSISAMDRAINSLPPPDVCELKYQSPVTVTQYYKALLTDEAWNKLRTSVPANRKQLTAASGKKTFEEAFKNAYFHFSHYGKANDASPIHDSCSWAYWLRGTAIVCQLNQELTDRMTPIYFPGFGNVGPETMSANLDQDKTGQSVNPLNVGIQSAEDLSIFSEGNKLPYIAAVHCYAYGDEGIRVSNPERDCTPTKVDKVAPRYQIDFCGLSAYANITDADKATIQAMIDHTKDHVFTKHPRSYGIPSVRQMLPVLAKDADSTKWFGGYNRASPTAPTSRKRKRKGDGKRRATEAKDLDTDGDDSDSDSNVRKRSKKLRHGESSSKSKFTGRDTAGPSVGPSSSGRGQVATTSVRKRERKRGQSQPSVEPSSGQGLGQVATCTSARIHNRKG